MMIFRKPLTNHHSKHFLDKLEAFSFLKYLEYFMLQYCENQIPFTRMPLAQNGRQPSS